MRTGARRFALAAFVSLAACGSGPGDASRDSSSAAALSAAIAGDSADTSCQIVLRTANVNLGSRLGPQTDCSSGTCWVMVWVTFDVAMSQSLKGSEAYVLYEGEGSTTWQRSREALPVFGAAEGFRRYQVVLDDGTFRAGPGDQTVSLIPFLQVAGGGRVFDHNRIANVLGSYAITPGDTWTVGDDPAICKGAAPAGTLSLGFASGWRNSASGALVPGGKIDVTYDIQRLPQDLSCAPTGEAAFATVGYVRFEPGGEVSSELVAPWDVSTSGYTSAPVEFDVPAGTRSASLWFETTSECGGAHWDSDFGQNFDFFAP